MKDLKNNIGVVSVLDPIAISATATHSDIDLVGFNSATLLVSLGLDAGTGLGSSHNLVFTLQHSDDGTTYTDVATADMIGLTVASGVVITVDAVGEDNSVYELGYIGEKRYLQLVYTATGTVSVPVSVVLLKGHANDAPV